MAKSNDSPAHSIDGTLNQPAVQAMLLGVAVLAIAVMAGQTMRWPNPSIETESHDTLSPATNVQLPPGTSDKPLLRIDLNTASKRELALMPRVGPVLATRIVANREQHGRFESLQDLSRVHGVGEKTIDQLERFCEVNR